MFFNIFDWKIPWTGAWRATVHRVQRVGHDWACTHCRKLVPVWEHRSPLLEPLPVSVLGSLGDAGLGPDLCFVPGCCWFFFLSFWVEMTSYLKCWGWTLLGTSELKSVWGCLPQSWAPPPESLVQKEWTDCLFSSCCFSLIFFFLLADSLFTIDT